MFCTHCGKELLPNDKFCTGCGAPVDDVGYEQDSFASDDTWTMQSAAYNEPYAPAPDPMKDPYNRQRPGRFNWGAFSLTIIWGIGNRCYITLLCLVPIVGIIMSFVAGFKGNEWALQKNRYRDMEEFAQVQDTWNRAGFVCFIAQLVLGGFWIFLALMSGLTLFTVPFLGDVL